jgi:PIN domain nuclease of toxin-antitoxin system
MILLDTHVLVWSQREPRKLSRLAGATIRRARVSSSVAVSAVTLVELASLISRGRIRTSGTVEDTIRQLIDEIEVLPLTSDIAIATSHFPLDSLPDPMDRIIAATARAEGIALVTADERMQNSPLVKTVW